MKDLATELRQALGGKACVAVFDELPTTMDEARTRIAQSEQPQLVIARRQTAGRGRLQREWVSPQDSGLYATLALRTSAPVSALLGLSLAVGVALARVLNRYSPAIALKWPNDILAHTPSGLKKLCGVLIELHPAPPSIIIGIGLNVFKADFPAELKAISLEDLSRQTIHQTELYSEIFQELTASIESFLSDGFGAFREEWKTRARLSDVIVTLKQGNNLLTSRALDVQEDGALVIQAEGENTPRVLYSADLEWAYAASN